MHNIFDGYYVGAGKEVTEDNLPGAKQVMTGVPAPPAWLQGDRAAQMQPTDADLNPAAYMIGEWTK